MPRPGNAKDRRKGQPTCASTTTKRHVKESADETTMLNHRPTHGIQSVSTGVVPHAKHHTKPCQWPEQSQSHLGGFAG